MEENFLKKSYQSKSGKKYWPTIGLEIHAELKTNSKMFCSCKNDPFNSKPNENICEICTAQPGALPYVNYEAVKKVLKVGKALSGKIADFSEFDRKNYFYPDMPKAYQISQYKYPLISGGNLANSPITRIHLEEDTASSSHKGEYSYVDFNRAGVPLMELVTEPEIKNSDHASFFAKELQLLLRTLDVSGANLEKGEMRIEANVSISEHENKENNPEFFGTKTEVKNLNSFKIVQSAIEYEIQRQIEVLEKGEKVDQETRGWDENKAKTFSQRKKENSEDYRYFPDPDIPKYKLSEISEFSEKEISENLPELPLEKRERYFNSFSLKAEDVEFFLQNPEYDKIFEKASLNFSENKKAFSLLSNYLTSDIAGIMKKENSLEKLKNFSAENMTKIISMILEGKISSRGAKDILIELFERSGDAEKIAGDKNLIQSSDEGELEKIVQEIATQFPDQVQKFKAGDENLLKFFMGQAMKKTGGSANPQILTEIFKKIL